MTSRLMARTPAGVGWREFSTIVDGDALLHAWFHFATNTHVLSSLVQATLPRSGKIGPQWHVSVADRSTHEPRRPSDGQALLARCAFDLLAAEEDNHHPGNARHFWMPVDPLERVDCECKETEVTIVEADGYRWTNPTNEACRGCENERVMRAVGVSRPCPIHRKQEALIASKGGVP